MSPEPGWKGIGSSRQGLLPPCNMLAVIFLKQGGEEGVGKVIDTVVGHILGCLARAWRNEQTPGGYDGGLEWNKLQSLFEIELNIRNGFERLTFGDVQSM